MSGLARAIRRIQHALGIGRTTLAPNDAGTVQTVQVQFNMMSVRDNVPVVFHFGFTACLPVGTDVVTTTLQGDPTSSVIVASNNQALRPKNLQPGEVQIFDAFGRSLYFTLNNGIVVEAANTAVTVKDATTVTITAANGVTINGNVQVNGKINATGDIVAGSISLRNHVSTAVQPGSGKSGPPQ